MELTSKEISDSRYAVETAIQLSKESHSTWETIGLRSKIPYWDGQKRKRPFPGNSIDNVNEK